MTLDDYDLMQPTTAATPNVSTKKCRRHDWVPADITTFDVGPDRRIDLSAGRGSVGYGCVRCGAVRDETVVRRNRNNRQRGSSFERTVAKKLGGRRTGPLGGRDDVMVGSLFSIQTKRSARFSLTEARTYLDDLRRTYPDRTPLVVHGLPGERGGVVIVSLDDWQALHGEQA